MRHLTFRVPLYLYNQILAFAEPKAMGLSEALRFIIENYLKEVEESKSLVNLIRNLDQKIDRLAASSESDMLARDLIGELHQLTVDSEKIKRALVILGGASPRTKAPLRELFPEHGQE
jgi:translation initiation factor 2B subunit (eIF-2B alpha/beta/delta family)